MTKLTSRTPYLALLLFLGFAAIAGAEAPDTSSVSGGTVPIIDLDEIERGQTGWGLSVFAGTEPERFELEVLGVVRHRTPELSYIMARLSGQGLEKSGVVGGMSGSPVYIDGRLAGAVAFSYLFEMDAVAGITPIAAMRRLGSELDLPEGVQLASAGVSGSARAAAPIEFQTLVDRDFAPALLDRHLERLRPTSAASGAPAVEWSAAGFGEAARGRLARVFGREPMASGTVGGGIFQAATAAGGAEDLGDRLVPGSAVGMVLLDGDFHMAAFGTITDRWDDEIVAFGHPVFSLGPLRAPMALSEVVTVISSRSNSFKISNMGPIVGAFTIDREAGVHGRVGLEAPMIPLKIHLRGLNERDYDIRMVDEPLLTPGLVALGVFGALEAASFTAGSQGVDLEARFALEGHEDLILRQSFDDQQAGIQSILYLIGFGAFLTQTDLADVEIESVEVEIHQVARPRLATLVGVHADRLEVEPGETVRLHLDFQPYRGERFRRMMTTTIPGDAPAGRYVLLVGDGTSMDAVRLAVERQVPQTFEQALELMQSFRPRSELRLFGLVPRPGLSVAGEVLAELPGSMRGVFAAGNADAAPLAMSILHRQTEAQDRPVEGLKRLDLTIRRPSDL